MLINKEKLKKQCATNPTAITFVEQIKAEVNAVDIEAIMKAIVVEDKYASGFYQTGYTMLKMAILRIVTEDKKYDDLMKKVIFKICDYPEWLSQGKGNGWNTDLLTGDISATVSAAYYLSKDMFTEEERIFVEDSICNKGIIPIYNEWLNPLTRRHSLTTMGHNWWAVCVAGAGIGLLFAGDRLENRDKILTDIVDGLKKWLLFQGDIHYNKHRNFGDDGDYIEYAGYMLYGLSNFSAFEELYRRATGSCQLIDVVPLDKTCDYILSFVHKIHDGKYSFAKISDTHAKNSNRLVFLYLANLYNRGDMVTLYDNFEFGLVNGFDFVHIESLKTQPAPINPKTLAVYNHTGMAAYHNNGIFMPIKTGETGCHNHRDTGHYMITYKNTEVVIDSGTCTYSKEEYLPYYCAPDAHNVILFSGEGVHEDGMYHGGIHGVGTIESVIDRADFKYLLADCTVPYYNVLQKNFRHFIMLKDVILVIDDVYARQEGEFESLLHYAGDITGTGDVQYIENKDVKVKVMHIAPFDFEFVTKPGMIGISGESVNCEYVSIKAKSEDRRQKFVRGFVFDDTIKISKKRTGDILEITIKRDGCKETILLNYGADKVDMFNSPHFEYGDVKTNAFITYLKEEEDSTDIAVINGFYMWYKGKLVYSDDVNNEVYISL